MHKNYAGLLQRLRNSPWLQSLCSQQCQTSARAFATDVESSTGSGSVKKEETRTGATTETSQAKGRLRKRNPTAEASVARSLLSLFDHTPTPAAVHETSTLQRSSSETVGSGLLAEPDAETQDIIRLVLRAVENCKPVLKVKQYKDGNRVVNIPYMVHPREQRSLAIRWILNAAHKRRDNHPGPQKPSISECLATELLLAARKEGSARAKRDEMHKLAVENRATVGKRLS